MPLIVSISGIRGVFGDGLSPDTLVTYASAYGSWLRERAKRQPTVVVGRDGRVTGEVCSRIVTATLQSVGCHVIDAGLATTPTVEMAVLKTEADGGIILSASHNPAEWNALKLLNERGEFLSAADGQAVIDRAESGDDFTVAYDQIGAYREADFLAYHIERILALPYIDPEQIAARDFHIVVDGINSVGGIALPALLEALGVKKANIHLVNGEPTGRFAHPAEPLPELVTAAHGVADALVEALLVAGEALALEVRVVPPAAWAHGSAKGICTTRGRDADRPLVEAIDRENDADVATTLVHEYAHAELHVGVDEVDERAKREVEAEAVAYVVGRHFGLDTSNAAFYLAAWQGEDVDGADRRDGRPTHRGGGRLTRASVRTVCRGTGVRRMFTSKESDYE